MYVRAPEGYKSDVYADGEFVLRLKKQLYGLRSAPQAWQEHLAAVLTSCGFQRLVSCPTLFRHSSRPLVLDIHVDDIHAAGEQRYLLWLFEELRGHLMVKVGAMNGPGDEYEFLRGVRKRESSGMWIIPNPVYAEVTAKELGLNNCKETKSLAS